VIDPHTADGVKVALEHREEGIPMIVLETALPAKFSETIQEALEIDPPRPADLAHLESLPQRFEVLDASSQAIKQLIETRLGV
jgi:threonine synthase